MLVVSDGAATWLIVRQVIQHHHHHCVNAGFSLKRAHSSYYKKEVPMCAQIYKPSIFSV
jgi:hypothetical protein